jgi:two-component system, chemotaxis family, chemotaxis protein CheY
MERGRVLVVDDNSYARQAVCLILTKAGYEVIEAEDGQTAVQIMARENSSSHINTVVCDLEMPHLDGSETISYFKRHHPLIPVVILTGASDFVLTEVLSRQGVTDYLLKPVSEKRLLEVIRVNVRLHELRRNQANR